MGLWRTVTWDVARAGGLTTYVLLTASVLVGLALSLQFQSPRWPRLINNALHNYLTLLGGVFLGVHILAVAVDPFTRFGLNALLIPFASHYRPTGLALGIVGLYLALAIGLSTWLRPRIGYQLWRKLHVLTLAVYAFATVHGIMAGTDTRSWWAVAMYGVSVVMVGALVAVRFGATSESKARPLANAPQKRAGAAVHR
jgi:predicted ferric reductase